MTAIRKPYLLTLAALGWFALIAQFYLHMNGDTATALELLIRFFTYFTVLTNILIGMFTVTMLFNSSSKLGQFFARFETQTAITVYIVVVGLVYNLILRSLWSPVGLQRLVDELLHSVIPLMYLFYWLFLSVKTRLQWKQIIPWMLYPAVYTILVLVRGTFSGFYPYPFMDVDTLGFNTVLVNCVGVTGIFVFFSALFVIISRLLKENT